MEVEVVFLVADEGPIFYGVFDSYLKVYKHFMLLGAVQKKGVKGLGCFELDGACYTVQPQTMNQPSV